MATLQRPELILLDEHTAALDPATSKTVMDLTEKLITEQNLTAFMVTHDMEFHVMCDHESSEILLGDQLFCQVHDSFGSSRVKRCGVFI